MKKLFLLNFLAGGLLLSCDEYNNEISAKALERQKAIEAISKIVDQPAFSDVANQAVIIFPKLMSAEELNNLKEDIDLIAVRMYIEGGVGTINIEDEKLSSLAPETQDTLKSMASSTEKRNRDFLKAEGSKLTRQVFESDWRVRAKIAEGIESEERIKRFNSYSADQEMYFAMVVRVDKETLEAIAEKIPNSKFSLNRNYVPAPRWVTDKQISFLKSSVKYKVSEDNVRDLSTTRSFYDEFVRVAFEKYGVKVGDVK